ncbi:uncharacterized protein LOC127720708 [Mytilus californianus]|uniref:uncharacterized protein LOC127720708 n=1 Tax=Mytilus californianus TaxID=6549 RepID=UPI002247DC0F|nr:uncharacterized protein LOC127720708 [Mytilus californianus]
MSWSRPPWSQGYPYSGFPGQGFHGQGFPGQGFPNQVFPSQVPSQPFPGFWPYCGPITTPVIVPQSTTSNLSVPAPPLAVSTIAPVLKDSSLPPEVKPFLLQVDKALVASQLLIMGSIANCTLSKRAEILDKAKVSDNLKDALIKSPLDDKIFGLPLNEVQKHLNQTPASVKVNVSLSGNNSKRGSYSPAGGSSYNSQEKRRKMTNDGGNKPKKSSFPKSKPNSFKRGGKRANPSF